MKLKSISESKNVFYGKHADLILRLGFGILFVVAGLGKFMNGVENFAGFLGWLGPLAGVFAWIVTLAEFFGGLALIFNVFVNWVSLLSAFIMLVAILSVGIPGVMAKGAMQLGNLANMIAFLSGFLAIAASRWLSNEN